MASKRLSAVVTIGGAVAGTFKTAIKGTKASLQDVGQSIRDIKKRQDLLSKSIDTFGRQGKDVSRMREEYARLGNEIDRLRRRQDALKRLQDAGLSRSFSNMTRQVGGLARNAALLGGAAAAGVFGLANSTATLGDQTAKTADKLGIGIEQLQELRYSAERSGLAANTLDMALQRFVRRVAEASNGSGEAVSALEELGLSASALASMTPDEALAVTADALKDVKSQSDRVRLAFKLFDSEGVGMVNMLKDGSAGLNQLASDARATGYVLSEQAARDAEEFKDRLLDAQLAMGGIRNTLGARLMPVVARVFERFSAYVQENRAVVEQYADRFAGLVERAIPALFQLAESGVQFATTLAKITSTVAGLVGGFDNLATIAAVVFSAKAIASVVSFGMSIFKVGSALVTLAGGLPAVAAGIKAIGLALMANPIGLIIGGIAVAGLLIYKYWEPIKGFVSGLWDSITSRFSSALDVIKSVFGWTPLGLLMKNWGGISDWWNGLWDGLVNSARAAFDWVVGKIKWIGDAWRKVSGWFGGDDASQADAGADPVAAVAAEPTISTSAPAMASQMGSSMGDINVTVHAAPGQSAQQIAEQVWRLIQDRMAQQQRGALYDTAGAY